MATTYIYIYNKICTSSVQISTIYELNNKTDIYHDSAQCYKKQKYIYTYMYI